jgi:ABC-type glycerol-3-phosphate transport system substrate-binding protein
MCERVWRRFRRARRAAACCAVLLSVRAASTADRKEITVWLMPAEPASPNAPSAGEEIRREIDEFNQSLKGKNITVVNTQPPLATQLIVRNPQFAAVNWSWVSSQLVTIAALEDFASQPDHKIHVNLRFVTWDEAFQELSDPSGGAKGPPPDVVQIGTTWSGYFASAGRLASRPGAAGHWRVVRKQPAAALPYINDARLLFYWRRRYSQSPSSPEFLLDGRSWETIVESFQRQGDTGDSIALAAGLTLNLLHDYASFVWAGGGKLLSTEYRDHIDLTSREALRVPLLLTRSVRSIDVNRGPRQTVSFPDAPHEEVSRLFVNDAYRATLEPADFISRWYIDFNEKEKERQKHAPGYKLRNFWDYAGVLAPPSGFRGGSELVVLTRPGKEPAEEAFQLAEFIATNAKYTEMLARYGHLPSLSEDSGLGVLVRDLAGSTQSGGAAAFQAAARIAIKKGRTYPDIDTFPTVLESPEGREALQKIWRRMAEGDEAAVAAAAKEAEFVLNSRIDWVVRLENQLRDWIPFILIAAVAGICIYVFTLHVQNEQRLAVLVYHASVHATLPSYGLRLIDSATEARRGRLTPERFLEQVEQYARHLSGPFYMHTATLAGALGREMHGRSVPMEACELAQKAKDGAESQFEAVWMTAPPALQFEVGPCGEWAVAKLPNLATVVLQEWLYNTLKRVSSSEISDGVSVPAEARVKISVDAAGFHIETPLSIKQAQREILESSPQRSVDLTFGGMGLKIILNLLWLGYRRRPTLESSEVERGTRVTFPFPMKRLPKSAAKGSQ